MKFKTTALALLFGPFSAVLFSPFAAAAPDADDQPAPLTTTNNADSRYGLFDGLDRRSAYKQEVFPEPFLVEDMAWEDNELEFTWLHSKTSSERTDTGSVEVQKGFGLLTLEAEAPYEVIDRQGANTEGVGNIQLGARYPFYQTVSEDKVVDSTFGIGLEGGIPVRAAIDRNPEFAPEIFNDLRLGGHFTIQSVLGYSILYGGGDDGGSRSFEYGFSLGYALNHDDLPLPGITQFIPMFEIDGERGLNKDEAGQDSVVGDAGFRLKFKPIGEMQPGFGVAYIFPMDSGGREEFHWGCIVSFILDF